MRGAAAHSGRKQQHDLRGGQAVRARAGPTSSQRERPAGYPARAHPSRAPPHRADLSAPCGRDTARGRRSPSARTGSGGATAARTRARGGEATQGAGGRARSALSGPPSVTTRPAVSRRSVRLLSRWRSRSSRDRSARATLPGGWDPGRRGLSCRPPSVWADLPALERPATEPRALAGSAGPKSGTETARSPRVPRWMRPHCS